MLLYYSAYIFSPKYTFCSYYEEQLQKFNDTDADWKIKSILKERTRKGRKESLVEWLGFPPSAASWIDNSQLTASYGDKNNKKKKKK